MGACILCSNFLRFFRTAPRFKSAGVPRTFTITTTKGDTLKSEVSPDEKAPKRGRFAEMYEKLQNIKEIEASARTSSFPKLIRNSMLVDVGDVEQGRTVSGTIVNMVGNELYIDFGGKFQCVCRQPSGRIEPRLHRGDEVTISLTDLELSSAFLGSEKHVTLLEADAALISSRSQHK